MGARLTLSIPVVDGLGHQFGVITLHATLLPPLSSSDIEPPPAVVVEGMTYRIVDMHVSENAIEVHTTMSGALIDRDIAAMQQLLPPKSSFRVVCYPGVFLVDASGTYQIPIAAPDTPNTNNRLLKEHVLDETRLFARTQPGPYRIVVSGGGCSSAPPAQPLLASWSFSG